jgi:hypothetical protein
MRAAMLFAAGLGFVLLVPLAGAQSPAVRVRVTPQYDEVALGAGQRGGDDLSVKLDIVSGTCTAGTQFGVSLVLADPFPSWAGASVEPMNLKFGNTGGTQTSRLQISPGEDAPPGKSVTYKIRPEVRLPPSANCTANLVVDSADAMVKLTILRPDQTAGPSTTAPKSSPGSGLGALLLAVGVCLGRRRA